MTSGTSTPLLPAYGTALPARSTLAIATLGAGKVLLGVASIIAPRLTCKLFLLDISPDAYIIGRLFGSSAAALGGLLWCLQRRALVGETTTADLRLAVVANIMADSIDLISCTVAFASGKISPACFGMLGGGCAVLAALGAAGLWKL